METKYVDVCDSFIDLVIHSNQLKNTNYKYEGHTFTPNEGDLALVKNEEYIFQNNFWNRAGYIDTEVSQIKLGVFGSCVSDFSVNDLCYKAPQMKLTRKIYTAFTNIDQPTVDMKFENEFTCDFAERICNYLVNKNEFNDLAADKPDYLVIDLLRDIFAYYKITKDDFTTYVSDIFSRYDTINNYAFTQGLEKLQEDGYNVEMVSANTLDVEVRKNSLIHSLNKICEIIPQENIIVIQPLMVSKYVKEGSDKITLREPNEDYVMQLNEEYSWLKEVIPDAKYINLPDETIGIAFNWNSEESWHYVPETYRYIGKCIYDYIYTDGAHIYALTSKYVEILETRYYNKMEIE